MSREIKYIKNRFKQNFNNIYFQNSEDNYFEMHNNLKS